GMGERRGRELQQLSARVPEELAERRVHARQPAVRVRDPNTYRRVFKSLREALLGRVRLRLDSLALGDVAGDRADADDLPGVIAVRRDVEFVNDALSRQLMLGQRALPGERGTVQRFEVAEPLSLRYFREGTSDKSFRRKPEAGEHRPFDQDQAQFSVVE